MIRLKIIILFSWWKILLISIIIFIQLISPNKKWVVERYEWCYPKMIVHNSGLYFEEICQDRNYFRKEK